MRRDGRHPAECAAVFQGLMTERAWELPAVGGTVLDHWPDIASAVSLQFAAHAAAVAFHPESGQLDLRPDSPAYATQLRLISARIITAANDHVGTGAVRRVHVLPAGTLPAPRPATPDPAPIAAAPAAPVQARKPAPEGNHAAIATHRAVAVPAQRVDPAIARAVDRQTRPCVSSADTPSPTPQPSRTRQRS